MIDFKVEKVKINITFEELLLINQLIGRTSKNDLLNRFEFKKEDADKLDNLFDESLFKFKELRDMEK